MKLGEIFVKDISRSMNPVIKVNDLDDSALYQELDEYVVTKDIDRNLEKLYKGISSRFAGGGGDKDHIGVWISGDFGSGKSHFLKITSLLLQNSEIHGMRAVDYFKNKPSVNPSVLQMMLEVGRRNVDTILFDIDSKSKKSNDEDALVQVFMGVFNEKLGLCSDPAVAKFERYLMEKGLFDEFKTKYASVSGSGWEEHGRNRVAFEKKKIADALVQCGAYASEEEAKDVADSVSKSSQVSVEEFVEIVGEYCESRGPDYTLFFMADEVGQFISGNVQKMLKLQTITERIGVRCRGQVWIVVTSQEDVDAVVSGVSSNDFSKIQGRFTTRIKMASSDVKEVIEKRVLQKMDEAATELGAFYDANRTDIQNRLCMTNQAEIRLYRDRKEFVDTYPFIPYQYPMLQDMLTSLRCKSASGKNLSNAARSMLKIFKETAAGNEDMETDFIAPLYSFYDAIQPELDSPTTNVFHNAEECTRLNGFDIDVLKTLFLVKYYDRLEKNLDNITALMISSFDQNRLDLRRQVKESLDKLARENYIQANADVYMFLTNEEQEISREIKNESIDPGSVFREISKVAFGSVFKLSSGKLGGYQFNKYVDDENTSNSEHELSVRILVTDRIAESFLPMKSMDSILFKLSNGDPVTDAFTDYIRTENYILRKSGVQQTASIRSILEGKREDLEKMKGYARTLLEKELRDARIFVNGDESTISDSLSAEARLREATEKLVRSVYSKHGYIRDRRTSSDIERFLRNRSTAQYDEVTAGAQNAFLDVSDYLELSRDGNRPVTVKDLMDRFRRKPYGFETEDLQWILSVMLRYGRIELVFDGKTLRSDAEFPLLKNCLLTSKSHDKTRVVLRQTISQDQISRAKGLITVLFARTTLGGEEDIVRDCNSEARKKVDELRPLTDVYRDHPDYPGKDELDRAMGMIGKLSVLNSPELFAYIDENIDALRNLMSEVQPIIDFLRPDSPQRRLFDRGAESLERCRDIRLYLDQSISDDLDEIGRILGSGRFSELHRLNGLCRNVDDAVRIATEHCREEKMKELWEKMDSELVLLSDHPDLCDEFRSECEKVSKALQDADSISGLQTALGVLPMKIRNLERRIPKEGVPEPDRKEASPRNDAPSRRRVMIRSTLSPDSASVESEEDVDRIVEALRSALKGQLGEGPFDIIW